MTDKHPIKAVLFDAAHTLFHVTPSVGAVYAAVAAKHGVQIEEAVLEQAFREVYTDRQRSQADSSLATSEAHERAWWHQLVWDVITIAGKQAEFSERYEAYFEEQYEWFARPDVWALYPDVMPALAALQEAGIQLGIVSNWDSRLHRLIQASALGSYFEVVVTSAEAGKRKPHTAPFKLAMARMGRGADEVIFVGDSLDEDVAGAVASGMEAILIRRDSAPTDGHSISRLTELLSLIRPALT